MEETAIAAPTVGIFGYNVSDARVIRVVTGGVQAVSWIFEGDKEQAFRDELALGHPDILVVNPKYEQALKELLGTLPDHVLVVIRAQPFGPDAVVV